MISGAVAAVEEAEEVCRILGIPTRRLPVSAAFHSPLMEAARAPFAEAVGRIQIHPTGTRVFSNATGGAYPADPRPCRETPGRADPLPGRFRPGDQDPLGRRGPDLCGGRAEIGPERPHPADPQGAPCQRPPHGRLVGETVRHRRPGPAHLPSGGPGSCGGPGPVGGKGAQKTETADEHPPVRGQLPFSVQKEARPRRPGKPFRFSNGRPQQKPALP